VNGAAGPAALPELASVPWRARTDQRWLRRYGRLWQAWPTIYTLPFLAAGCAMLALEPAALPVALATLAHAWIIPELYAFRGATVLRPKHTAAAAGEPVAQGLLGDLLGHEERELQRRTGLALERSGLGVWLVGQAGAVLVTPGGRRVHCFCVRVPEPELPRPTGSPTCCLRCAATSRASRPSPTTPSRAPSGACGAACRSRCGPRSTPPACTPGEAGGPPPAEAPAAPASPASVAFTVAIAGRGFGGLYAARRLERRLPRHSARIVLVSESNYLLYMPLLPGAGAGSLEPRQVARRRASLRRPCAGPCRRTPRACD
jgi:hypothetical protein